MKTFLSIDIDYFNDISTDDFSRFLDNIPTKYKNICSVTNHEQMLELVNNSDCRKLVNVDLHSDLATEDVTELNCGTWVTYVEWRNEGVYHWIEPKDNLVYGECNGDEPIFIEGSNNIRKNRQTGWKNVKKFFVKELDLVNNSKKMFYGVKEICFCESPSYSDEKIRDYFVNWRKNKGIKHIEGGERDDFTLNILPTGVKWVKV